MNLINIAFTIAQWLIIARVIIAWIPSLRYNPIGRLIVQIVDPCLRPLQRLVPPWKTSGFDISPILAFIILRIIYELLRRLL